jgi:hypothetical protein
MHGRSLRSWLSNGTTRLFLHQLSHCDALSPLVCICCCNSHHNLCHRSGRNRLCWLDSQWKVFICSLLSLLGMMHSCCLLLLMWFPFMASEPSSCDLFGQEMSQKFYNDTAQETQCWGTPNHTKPQLHHWPTFLISREHGTILTTNIDWQALRGLYWICGKQAYLVLPSSWLKSCMLGSIRPSFFLLPLRQNKKTGSPHI